MNARLLGAAAAIGASLVVIAVEGSGQNSATAPDIRDVTPDTDLSWFESATSYTSSIPNASGISRMWLIPNPSSDVLRIHLTAASTSGEGTYALIGWLRDLDVLSDVVALHLAGHGMEFGLRLQTPVQAVNHWQPLPADSDTHDESLSVPFPVQPGHRYALLVQAFATLPTAVSVAADASGAEPVEIVAGPDILANWYSFELLGAQTTGGLATVNAVLEASYAFGSEFCLSGIVGYGPETGVNLTNFTLDGPLANIIHADDAFIFMNVPGNDWTARLSKIGAEFSRADPWVMLTPHQCL